MSKPYSNQTSRDINLKSGIVIPAGTEASVTWSTEGGHPTFSAPSIRPDPFTLSNRAVAKAFGFDVPDMETIEEWHNDDGGCESILGEWVEPDGHDEHGAPSWLLAMGLI